jgi:hypothetical protein
MNGPAREDVLHFIEQRFGRRLTRMQESDVLAALDLDGKDAADFMADFAREFTVDLTGYEPRFHHRPEVRTLQPSWPMPAPYQFGVRFPLAVGVLVMAAQTGRWPVFYPVLTPMRSLQWVNAPLVLIGLPVMAAIVLALVQFL